ncbi:LuxR C-terminal-related transcriptional regulator [Candidatus Solirubrobacter pratensis]|uniref:LuxR C-terminal-related transcriptional regulator n=1 Tax=Candidatus Solirubrobacter pratensis TaxID=1298857 RepID=UPI0004279B18|nr:LuxR C-terminal-related transcriptional regulator [Candidatus Solirubrobacter pratensis]
MVISRARPATDPPALPGILRSALFERLASAGRVTLVSASAGSGKTMLLRTWIAEARLTDRVGWVSVRRGERDPQRFWIAVLDALRRTQAGSRAVGSLTPAPGLEGGAIVERLLEDLESLTEPLWLVVDDLHELGDDETLRQLGVLVLRAPAALRFAFATRRDLRLGLHRLRLEGELTELRAGDLRFTIAEARALFDAAGVTLPEPALTLLHERTEGWAAGLRLAALSLVRHPDPEGLAADFGGSERTVAEYLLHEVLERQPDEVRRLLLRTSILDRVNGPLADLLTGRSGSELILQELEEAGAFVVSLDGPRSWFRYHQLFSELLQLELRRTAPDELSALHGTAAAWFAEHDDPAAAVRHAQEAGDWATAARVLADNVLALWVDGRGDTMGELLARFPVGALDSDPRLLALLAGREVTRGSLPATERYLALATQRLTAEAGDTRGTSQALLAVIRLRLARQRVDLPAAVEAAQQLLAPHAGAELQSHRIDDELRTLALLNLGTAESWAARSEDAERHLEYALALARRTRRPYLEIGCLANLALTLMARSFELARRASLKAIELARTHGWAEEPIVGIAYTVLGGILVWQGRLDEAEPWLGQARRALRAELEPAEGLLLRRAHGMLQLARGHDEEALTALRSATRLDELLSAAGAGTRPHALAAHAHALMLQTNLRLGELEAVEAALAEMAPELRDGPEVRKAIAALRLAQDEPQAATAVLAPVLDGSVASSHRAWLIEALVLYAIARHALAQPAAAEETLERALDLAEPDGVVWPFLVHRTAALLERHQRHRSTHAALISEIRTVLAGDRPTPSGEPQRPREPLSESELRVLRYLPTNLTAPEIAGEVYLAVSTVKTHIQHIYAKLGVNRRADAVERARDLRLLAPSALTRQ